MAASIYNGNYKYYTPPPPRLQTTFTEASLYSTLRMFPHYQLWKLLNLRLLRSAPKIRKVNNHILETPSVIGDYREGMNDSLESQVQVMQMKRGERVIEMFMALFSWTKYPFFPESSLNYYNKSIGI